MKKIYTLILLFFCFLLMSCNTVGSKDAVVAKIGSETLYAEDLDFQALQNSAVPSTDNYKIVAERLLYSLAKVSKINGESKSYDSAWKAYEPIVRNRLLTIVYTRDHLMGRLGYADEDLKKYFKEHRDEFDSSVSYLQVRGDVAGRYFISQNQDSLKRFIQKTLPEKDEPANVEVLFYVADSLAVADMVAKFNATVPEDSLPLMRHTIVYQGKEKGVFADSSVIKALFLADSMAVGTGRGFRVLEDSVYTYFALKLKVRNALKKAKEEDFRKILEQNFVTLRRESIAEEIQKMGGDLGDVVIEKLTPKDPHKYYEDNKDKFMTVPGYEVYHVAMKDSAVLVKTMENVKDLESFRAVAATISEKEETSDSMGYVGKVKKNYALPYGIGMMPALWLELEGKKPGYISSAIHSLADSLYHCFYVLSVVPSEPKAFDRVEKLIESAYADDVESLDPATVLISERGKPVYRKADLLKIFDAEPGIPYNKNTHYNLVNMLAQAYAIGEKARHDKVDDSWEFRALLRLARVEFISNRYDRMTQISAPTQNQIPENLKKFEYYYGKESIYKGKSFEESLSQITGVLTSRARVNAKVLSEMEAWNKANVFFYDRDKMELAPITSGEGVLASGDSAAKKQKFDEAISAYQKVVNLFADRDTLFRMAVYGLAQVYSDAQKYNESAACFEAFLKIWPDAPEAEKALFSLGFILNENLKINDRALEVLEEFQKRFPKSELKESVDWLVENIKSDGKLADDLMKKIEAEE